MKNTHWGTEIFSILLITERENERGREKYFEYAV